MEDPATASAELSGRGPRAVRAEFVRRIGAGLELVCSGSLAGEPLRLLELGHGPKSRLDLFGFQIYLTHPRQNPDLRFFVAYVVPPPRRGTRRRAYARLFYKDISLIWRAASHLFLDGDEMWIGKGDTRVDRRGEWEFEESAEWTTDLPFEMQTALEELNRGVPVRTDHRAPELLLQRASRQRIRAFRDFTAPRERAQREGRAVAGDRKVVWFERLGDPSSLRILPGYEPDFASGPVERYVHGSRLYDGEIQRLRFVSTNREIQHLMFLAPEHMWMVPPQTLDRDLTSYAVRPVQPNFDEEAYVPGYEYHFEDEHSDGDDPQLHSQIPPGYVGPASDLDDSRADASAWLDEIPVLQELRRRFG